MVNKSIPVDLILKNLAEQQKTTKLKFRKGTRLLTGKLDTRIGATPFDVVYQEDRIKLRHYKPENVRCKTPLLIIYALINRHTMLDLQPRRSVVETLLENGIEIYLVDWGYPTRKDQYLTIDDHVNGYMDNVVTFICNQKKLSRINLMGICMGGTFSVIYTSLHPQKIKNLVLTVTPTNFDTNKGLLHIWMRHTKAETLSEVCGNMPGDIMNLGFLLLNPARLMIDKYVGFVRNMDDKAFVENFVRMEKWIFDSPDVPAATFREFITDCYKNNQLIQSKMRINGKRVDLKNITMPVLNFYGEYDHLVPPEACNLITRKVASTDTEDICFKTGHIGIYVSSKYQREFAPTISRWLKQRD